MDLPELTCDEDSCSSPSRHHLERAATPEATPPPAAEAELPALQLFDTSSPRRIGESLRSAAAKQFPSAVDRIVRESVSLGRANSESAVQEQPGNAATTPVEIEAAGAATKGTDNINASSDSFASSFASLPNTHTVTSNASISSGGAAAPAAAPPASAHAELRTTRSKSFFAALLDSTKSESSTRFVTSAAAPGVAVGSSSPGSVGVDAPRRGYRCKVSIVGDSGSGKSTFQHCFSHSVLKTLPEVPPSACCGCSVYYFKSQTKREKLDILVVDSGPSSLTASLSHVLQQTNLYVLTLSLSGVKQRTSKKFLSFGNEPSAIIHSQDKDMIRSYVAKMCAVHERSEKGPRAPQLVVVGTHKDLLSDQTRDAVETVLRELNSVVQAVVRDLPNPPRLLGCFAVSCVDHSCVPENRGGPKTINELWAFVCDILLKEATQLKATTGDTPAHAEDVERWMSFDRNEIVCAPSAASAALINSELRAVSDRVITFVRRAKNEMNFVVVHMQTLRQVAFSLGVYARDHLESILHFLARDGEILVLHQQPQHVGGREDSVVLWPHLADRSAVMLAKYQQLMSYPVAERSKVLPGLDIDVCQKYDKNSDSCRGVFHPKLMVCLSKTLSHSRRSVVERAETFVLLLLLSDFVFQRRVVTPCDDIYYDWPVNPLSLTPQPHAHTAPQSPEATTPLAKQQRQVTTGSTTPPASTVSGAFHSDLNDACSSASRRSRVGYGVVYVAPSLVRDCVSAEAVAFFESTLLRGVGGSGILFDGRPAVVLVRSLRIPVCPLDVYPKLVCRWGPFVEPRTRVFRDAVLLHRSQGHDGSIEHDASLQQGDDSVEPTDDASCEDLLSMDQPGALKTRCFVRAVFHSFSSGQKCRGVSSGQDEAPPTLEVRLVILTSEDLLAAAHFITSILRVGCHMLDTHYPGLGWRVEEDFVNSATALAISTEMDVPAVRHRLRQPLLQRQTVFWDAETGARPLEVSAKQLDDLFL